MFALMAHQIRSPKYLNHLGRLSVPSVNFDHCLWNRWDQWWDPTLTVWNYYPRVLVKASTLSKCEKFQDLARVRQSTARTSALKYLMDRQDCNCFSSKVARFWLGFRFWRHLLTVLQVMANYYSFVFKIQRLQHHEIIAPVTITAFET